MSTKPSVLFFGNERLATGTTTAAPALQALIAAGYQIEAVITSSIDGVSRQKRALEIGALAHQHNIPVVLTGHKIDLVEKVKKHQTEIAVLAAFGQIIPQSVIDLFPKGIVNIHPSLLPNYRGSTPIEAAILNGDQKAGVSLMKIAKEMDAGPVYDQNELALSGTETKQELADNLGKLGAKLLIACLPKIIDGKLNPLAQSGEPTYCKLIQKTDGELDPDKDALELERQVRAFAGWPTSYLDTNDQHLIITRGAVSSEAVPPGQLHAKDHRLYYGCRDGSLELLEIQPAGKKPMDAKSFINGYKAIL